MRKYVLGLDIGIASVGWGLIDQDSGEVIDAGVRLFSEAANDGNLMRRTMRSSRRRIRRRRHRLDRMADLLERIGLLKDSELRPNIIDVYELRCKGLREQLKPEELVAAILHLTKRRGIDLDIPEDEESLPKGEQSTKSIIQKKRELLKTHYVCEVQLQELKEKGYVRGIENRYRIEDYRKELKQLLDTQSKYYDVLDDDVKEEIISIFESKRHYSDGPGSEKSPTPYGRYRENENGEIKEFDLIELMRGKCTYFPDELREPKMSYLANKFNLLNDLNNINYGGRYLTKEEKEELLNNTLNVGKNVTAKMLEKLFDASIELISGYRQNKDGKFLITEVGNASYSGLKVLLDIAKEFKMEEIILSDFELVDKIIEILTRVKEVSKRITEINKVANEKYPKELVKAIANDTKIKGYHSLSRKAMNLAIDEMIHEPLNQMQVFHKLGIKPNKKYDFKGRKYIPVDVNDDEVISPIAKRSQRETFKVLNAIIKKYGFPSDIVVEMAREKNSKEQKKFLDELQKKNEKLNEEVKRLIGDSKRTRGLHSKIRLYLEQDGICAYTLEPINFELLIKDPTAYEIDHIIPISVSLDDSNHNKVLVTYDANQHKGQNTPYMYFKSGTAKKSFEEFKSFVLDLYNRKQISWQKKNNLLFTEDINKEDVRLGFVGRNLSDTRYAMRVFYQTIKSFIEDNEIDARVHSVKGTFTSIFRKKIKLDKDREESHEHHAIDALIVAALKKLNAFNKLSTVSELSTYDDYLVDAKTGEVLNITDDDVLSDSFFNFLHKVISSDLKVKYSHKVDRKANREIANQTIYGTRKDKDGNLVELKRINIYDDKGGKDLKKIILETPEKLYMYHYDKKTFELLLNIVNEYKEEQNPFKKYYEGHGYIRKPAKNGNGPIIKTIKLQGNKINNYIPLGHKYDVEPEKVVLQSLKPYRVDIYYDGNSYKFITVTQEMCKFTDNELIIDLNKYNVAKENKKITEDYKFQFSLYNGNVLEITKDNELEKLVYISAKTATELEFKPINRPRKQGERIVVGINKKINKLRKIEVDVLGNEYPVTSEKFTDKISLY